MPTVIIFMPVPYKKPKKAPHAALKARSVFSESCISSPTKAPINGPAIMPKGPTKKPTIKPIVAPIEPDLEPPVFFVIKTGKILSITETRTAKAPQIQRVTKEISFSCEKNAKSKPAHARGAPGIIGRNVPKKPTPKSKPAKTVRIKSPTILLPLIFCYFLQTAKIV